MEEATEDAVMAVRTTVAAMEIQTEDPADTLDTAEATATLKAAATDIQTRAATVITVQTDAEATAEAETTEEVTVAQKAEAMDSRKAAAMGTLKEGASATVKAEVSALQEEEYLSDSLTDRQESLTETQKEDRVTPRAEASVRAEAAVSEAATTVPEEEDSRADRLHSAAVSVLQRGLRPRQTHTSSAMQTSRI